MAWSLSERDRSEPEPLEGKLFEKELDALGEWFSNTAYGKRFKEGQERNAALEQTIIDQGGIGALYFKLKNTPNELEQKLLKGISDVTGIDERVTTPITYVALSGGIRNLSKLKPTNLGFSQSISPATNLLSSAAADGARGRSLINVTKQVDLLKKLDTKAIPSQTSASVIRPGGLFSKQPKSNLAAKQYTDELLAVQRAEAGLAPVPGKVNAFLSVNVGENVSKSLGIEKWSKALELVESGSGDPMRRASGIFLSSAVGPLGYTQTGAYTSKDLPAITNIHHAGFLEKLKRIPVAHSSFQEVKAAADRGEIIPSPIVEGLEKQKGIKMGNYTENTADVLETLQGPHKQAIQRQISEQIDLIHPDTANDLRSMTGVNLPDLNPKQLEQITSFKKLWPDEPFPEDQLPALTEKNFREIRIIHQNGKVEKWTPSNLDEFINRYNIVAQKVGAGIGEKISRKSMKISPKDEIFSSDHSTIHNYTERLELTPGNPIYDAEQAIATGTINTMSVNDAIELEYKSIEMMERVLGNTLKARYKHVLTVFKEKYPKGMPTKAGYAKWKDLGTDARRRFFRENVNEIARRGGLKRPISFKQSTRALVSWDKGLTDVFNWTPQTLKTK